MTARVPLYNAPALREAFDSHGLDAIVARSGRNVAYLSGIRFPGTLGRFQDFAHSPRAALVLWPRDAEPRLFVSGIALGLAKRESWFERFTAFTEYQNSPTCLPLASCATSGWRTVVLVSNGASLARTIGSPSGLSFRMRS